MDDEPQQQPRGRRGVPPQEQMGGHDDYGPGYNDGYDEGYDGGYDRAPEPVPDRRVAGGPLAAPTAAPSPPPATHPRSGVHRRAGAGPEGPELPRAAHPTRHAGRHNPAPRDGHDASALSATARPRRSVARPS